VPKPIDPLRKYRRYNDIRTGRKFYRPVYRGMDILMQQFPNVAWWQFDKAAEAQTFAERHEIKKRRQIERFQNEDYRKKALIRYAALVAVVTKGEEE